ncbi:MAG: acyl-CoA dehydrogenase family protein, partial [Pseudomonadota bacterium]
MNFELSEEQQRLYDEASAFATAELNDDLEARDEQCRFDERAWQKCGEFGALAGLIPTEYGGRGLSTVSTIAQLEGLGYGCRDNGLTLAINGQIWAVQEPILRFGSETQKERFLPGLCTGRLFGAHGMTETGSGSDAFSLSTTAEAVDGGYVLNGHKIYIGLAPVCDVALVFATTNPKLGQWGLTAFLVEADMEGFERGETQKKMGLRTGPFGELRFKDCFVPDCHRLAPVGAGVSVFNHCMEWERSFIFSSHVGAMARQLDETVTHARERKQFGQSIGQFQSVSNRIADMHMRLDASRLMLYRAAWLKDAGRPSARGAARAHPQKAPSVVAPRQGAQAHHRRPR